MTQGKKRTKPNLQMLDGAPAIEKALDKLTTNVQ
tara:strand:- start:798 stop:899 length:102 start_codon:yes stop_codon:yes gene_type:complete